MKKFILFALLILVGFSSNVRAESSATAYDQKYYSQQVFTVAYNNGSNTINRDNVVILDAPQSINPNNYYGSYITLGSTTDSVFIFGVADESILAGSLGRVCIRGPHKAVALLPGGGVASYIASGAIISASNQAGKFGYASTADGTASGRLGYILSATATTDTGDASNTYWVWIQPYTHK